MRHESVTELTEDEMELWLSDHESVSLKGNNWEFDLEEAKEKLHLMPRILHKIPILIQISPNIRKSPRHPHHPHLLAAL